MVVLLFVIRVMLSVMGVLVVTVDLGADGLKEIRQSNVPGGGFKI